MTGAPASPMDEALAELVRRRWGRATRIVDRIDLSSRAATVARLRLEGGDGAPPTVIVKHVPPDQFTGDGPAAINPEFAEELATHRFLNEIGAEQDLKPALHAFDTRGLTLMEDLGPRLPERLRTYDALIPALAAAYSRLHGRSRGGFARHEALRIDGGLGPSCDDRRRYGAVALSHRAAAARDWLLDRAGPAAAAAARELSDAIALVEEPGAFLCLIHDDLGNARQTFEVGDALYILDFEYARYAHALLDLCKPMLGKFELELDTGRYLWINPGFPPALAAAYRARLAEEQGIRHADRAWDDGLSAALIYAALALIGRLLVLEPDRRLVGTVAQNVNGILYRLHALLAPRPGFRAVRDFIPRFLGLPGGRA